VETALKILNVLRFVCLGAWGVLLYLHATLNPSVPEVEQLRWWTFMGFLLIMIVGPFFTPQSQRSSFHPDISPALSGSIVVLATGFIVAVALGWGFSQTTDLVVPVLVAILTLAAAWLVFRYASGNADEIGEARFVAPRGDSAGE